MLQQTQVERVIPYYLSFLKRFPTLSALAQAPLGDVLTLWQGLGYNRRAKMLHEAAKVVVAKYGGRMPSSIETLETLPGIGPYTARAVAAFAHNTDSIFIETNIRTVITHHFFPKKEKVADSEIISILTKVYPKGNAKEWYAALMDYGSYLKRSGVRINAKSATYTKQKTFVGSDREARGILLRALIAGSKTKNVLMHGVSAKRKEQFEKQLVKLIAEKLVNKQGTHYVLPQ